MDDPAGERRAAGDCIADRYLLVRLLETGGMGSVWVAHHLGLDVQVAIKFIRADAYSAVAAKRLIAEARAAASLDHAAIVHVSDVGRTAEGETYLVMELLDGEDLATVLGREKRLRPEMAVRVLLPIVGALSAMHQRGIVHRDVKPENIFLACDDSGRWQPKLIDFGLARAPGASARLTQQGAIVGTPDYMSPERMEGHDADPGDDIWALSVTLYQALAGALPFTGAPFAALRDELLACRPRSLLEHGACDAELWAIVERGLSHRPDRWASARELGKALAGWLWSHGGHDDISGVSLRPSWLGDEDVQRLSSPRSSLVATARFEAPLRAPEASPPAPAPREASAPAPALREATPPPVAMPKRPPVRTPPVEAPRPIYPPLALAFAVSVAAISGACIWRWVPVGLPEASAASWAAEVPSATPPPVEPPAPTATESAAAPSATVPPIRLPKR